MASMLLLSMLAAGTMQPTVLVLPAIEGVLSSEQLQREGRYMYLLHQNVAVSCTFAVTDS